MGKKLRKMKMLIFLLLPLWGFGQIKLDQKTSMLNDKVEISTPKELTTMTTQMWKLKYGSMQRPVLALSDKDVEVNLIAQFTNQPWETSRIAEYKDFRISNLKKSRNDLLFLGDGVKEIRGAKVGYLKFMSQAIDAKVFNYYFFTVVDGKILIFTFNCVDRLRDIWEKSADEIMESLKIN